MTINKRQHGITSPVKIIANIFISFVGAGLLGLPYAFKEAGIFEGTVIMSIVGYLSVYAMLMIIECKDIIISYREKKRGNGISLESKIPLMASDESDEDDGSKPMKSHDHTSIDLTYGDVGQFAYGKGGKRIVDIAIIISQIGFCCGYLIYLCETLVKHIDGLTRGQWLVLLLPPLYVLTLLRHLKKLAIFSLFAQISNVFALAVVFWFDFSHTEEIPFHPKELSLRGLPFFFAVSIYCYEGAGMILSLEGSVNISKRKEFRSYFVSTMVVLTVLYVSFGACGYLSYGPHTLQIITLNLPHGKATIDFAALVKIFLGISLFFTYPMMLFPVTHLIDKTFMWQNEFTKGNLARLVLVLLSGLVVTAIPSFAVLASLIGATCCTTLAFILPAAFHLKIFKNKLTKRQRLFDYFLIILGVIGTVVSLIDTVGRINETPIEHHELSQQLKDKSSGFKNITSNGLIKEIAEPKSSGITNLSHVTFKNVSIVDHTMPISPTGGKSYTKLSFINNITTARPLNSGLSIVNISTMSFVKINDTTVARKKNSNTSNFALDHKMPNISSNKVAKNVLKSQTSNNSDSTLNVENSPLNLSKIAVANKSLIGSQSEYITNVIIKNVNSENSTNSINNASLNNSDMDKLNLFRKTNLTFSKGGLEFSQGDNSSYSEDPENLSEFIEPSKKKSKKGNRNSIL